MVRQCRRIARTGEGCTASAVLADLADVRKLQGAKQAIALYTLSS